jgi:hypothetical protein
MAEKSIYTREFLLGLPEKHKKETLDLIISRLTSYVYRDAQAGKTSYIFDFSWDTQKVALISKETIFEAIVKTFPDSRVSYITEPATCILIDWS